MTVGFRMAYAGTRSSMLQFIRHALQAAIFLMAPLAVAPAQAGTATANMTVQITITASCTIASAPMLDFGSNASTALLSAAVTASTTVSVTCSNGSPYAIGFDAGMN